MPRTTKQQLEERIKRLESHLSKENPVLLQVVRSFRKLDKLAYRLGFMNANESYATQVPWWPLVSVLGSFSAGKSSFINYYVGKKIQQTGNQAVDDKFTVICYSNDELPKTLPGLALNADPRFPFYQISDDIEAVAEGQGKRIDSYIQLKTCASEVLKGKILIDSPGFDADEQRTSTLRITKHIINLSDLVLVMFDARHPESGAMQDTLKHLVADVINRPDTNKFLYILNQIDTCAREDNPEQVFAAWQRALTQKGLMAGRFYSIYNPDVAIHFADDNIRQRFETKRDIDIKEINERMEQIGVERAYRIIGVLEKTAKTIQNDLIPELQLLKRKWRNLVVIFDLIIFGVIGLMVYLAGLYSSYWENFSIQPLTYYLQEGIEELIKKGLIVGLVIIIAVMIHQWISGNVRRFIIKNHIEKKPLILEYKLALTRALYKSTRGILSVLSAVPRGWGSGAEKQITQIFTDADHYIQLLNDQYANPSGQQI